MSSAFYTTGPYWPWLIVTYCFVGGIAGGSFFLAALLDLFGAPRDRPAVRAGYNVAFVGVILSACYSSWTSSGLDISGIG
jgi:formate-dependent nitrite reductase membrane component NrfD